MKKHELSATPRTVTGRKVKTLRKTGMLPATVYGKNIKSLSVGVSTDAFSKVFKEAGETGLIELSVEKDVLPVLVNNVQVDPVSGAPIHIEFRQVDLKEKVTAKVPVEFTGESPAVSQKVGVLLTVLDEIEVEALPTDLPEHITIDMSILKEVNDEMKVGNITAPKGVTILTDPELTLVKIGSLVTKEAEAQAAAEAAAQAAAKAEAAPAAEAQTGEAAPAAPPEAAPPPEKK